MKRGLMILIMVVLFSRVSIVKADPLSVHPTNPRYFEDESGETIYLTGSHTWWLIHTSQGRASTNNSYERMEEYLDFMESHGHNFIRLWTGGWGSEDRKPYPWERTGPGNAHDGGLKFNMSKFNETYFELLRERVLQIQNRGMYCSVMFFGSGIGFGSGSWEKMAWHPDNNINPELANVFSLTDGHSFFTTDPDALETQRALVRKIIDTLNDVDNLILEIVNEADFPESVNWQYGMINYIKSYESNKPKQHLVGMTSDGRSFDNAPLRNSPADWISPDQIASDDDYENGGPTDYSDKILINDVDHLWGFPNPEDVESIRKWVWKTFARGNHPIFMDPYDVVNLNQGYYGNIDPVFDPIRDAMGYTLSYANRFSDLASMNPSETICDTTYCLYNPGVGYLVYQPNSGSFTVNLEAGDYDYDWFNPSSGSVEGTGTITVSSGSKSFTPPFSGDAVLYISSQNIIPSLFSIPGQIEAEDYKVGGEGIAYHDSTSGNQFGEYRNDDVDIGPTTDIGGGYSIGAISAGEWLAYDVDVESTGLYDITIRVASRNENTKIMHTEIDGVDVTGPMSFDDSSGWQSWLDITIEKVNLIAGEHELRIVMDTSGFNLNYISIIQSLENGCIHDADLPPCDGCVKINELIAYIGKWKTGSVSINELIEAIGIWKNGC